VLHALEKCRAEVRLGSQKASQARIKCNRRRRRRTDDDDEKSLSIEE
jgi:hypothetical protein